MIFGKSINPTWFIVLLLSNSCSLMLFSSSCSCFSFFMAIGSAPDLEANFSKSVYFSECKFQGVTHFHKTTFSAEADFHSLSSPKQISLPIHSLQKRTFIQLKSDKIFYIRIWGVKLTSRKVYNKIVSRPGIAFHSDINYSTLQIFVKNFKW
jgi:hypothetical protein